MAGRMTLSTRNLEAVKANLRQYEVRARERAKVVASDSMERVYQTQQALCPVDKGFMKDAVRKELTPAGFGYQVGWQESDFAAAGLPFYALHQEFGTRFQSAQPSLFPAIEAERPRFRAELVLALRARG
jgi:HK97 gp10 family phage protein